LIAAHDGGGRFGPRQVRIAAENLFVKADNAKRQIRARRLPDARNQRGVFRSRLFMQDTDVIGIQKKLHGV
jgi:hypothetical protein